MKSFADEEAFLRKYHAHTDERIGDEMEEEMCIVVDGFPSNGLPISRAAYVDNDVIVADSSA
jgi:hypothetical protein